MLDRADLDRYGLIGNATSTATPPATSAAEKANATLEQQAITFVARSIRDWSLPT